MKILVCADEAPLPPMNGFRLQLAPVCAELAKRHEVVVLAYLWEDQYGDPPEGVELQTLERPTRSDARRAYDSLSDRRPLGAVLANDPMAAAARRLVADRDFDIVHVGGWNLAGIMDELPGIPAVLTALDASFLNYQAKAEIVGRLLRPLYRREARRVQRYESSQFERFDSVVFVSDEDATAIREINPKVRTTVLPNGVDADFYAPDPTVERDPNLIVFTGAMQWAPNARAAQFLAQDVLPLVRAEIPEARLALVGRSPGSEVMRLAGLEHVEVTGEVPDVRDWLNRAAVFACPMVSGTGIKNKLLEALAMEVACVATPVACQGMRVADGRELLVADGPREHAERIVELLRDSSKARRIGAAGRRYMVAEHSWTAVGEAYERLMEDAIAKAQNPGPQTPGNAAEGRLAARTTE
jgi:glycosyltransferase involved in cell wall biosynthesis